MKTKPYKMRHFFLTRSFILISVTLIITVLFGGCSKSSSNPAPVTPLSVTSLSVSTGPYGTNVVITGTGFSSTQANNMVFFNGNAAVITAANTTAITTTVPMSAGTGNVTVSVGGKTVTGPVFTYQTSAVVTTFAGNGTVGATNGNGNLSSFNFPAGLAFDASGNLYVADVSNNLVRKITTSGTVSTFAGSGLQGSDNGALLSASFFQPSDLAFDSNNNLYVIDAYNNLVRKIANGSVSTFAGSGVPGTLDGTGTAAEFQIPIGITIDKNNNIYVGNAFAQIRKIDLNADVSTIAGSGKSMSVDGKGLSASFTEIVGLGVDLSGNIYIAQPQSSDIRKMDMNGTVTTIAGFVGVGNINGPISQASFASPDQVVVDATGNLYVADFLNNEIRKISTSGIVTTIAGNGAKGSVNGIGSAATFNAPCRLAIDSMGNLFVSDSGNNLIRKISFL